MFDLDDLPPMTPLDQMALHETPPEGLPPGAWWACERPEQPLDKTLYDWRCKRCVLHAQAVIYNGTDPEMIWRQSLDTTDGGIVRLSDLVRRSVSFGICM